MEASLHQEVSADSVGEKLKYGDWVSDVGEVSPDPNPGG